MQTTVRILGGLEVTVEFHVQPAEPDVGIMSACVDDWHIVEIAGRPLRKKESADWIYKRLSKRDNEAIEEAMYSAMESARYDYYED